MPTMTYEETQSELTSDGTLPPACFANPANGPGAAAYARYNCAGVPELRGMTHDGGHVCPQWHQLTDNGRAKWNAAPA